MSLCLILLRPFLRLFFAHRMVKKTISCVRYTWERSMRLLFYNDGDLYSNRFKLIERTSQRPICNFLLYFVIIISTNARCCLQQKPPSRHINTRWPVCYLFFLIFFCGITPVPVSWIGSVVMRRETRIIDPAVCFLWNVSTLLFCLLAVMSVWIKTSIFFTQVFMKHHYCVCACATTLP